MIQINGTKLQQTIATYNKTASEYAQNTEQKLNIEMLETFCSYLPKGRILDIGCGSGRDTSFLADRGYEVIGIDLSEKLLEQAYKLHPYIKVKLMDMRKLEFSDASFDGVWSHAAIHHLKVQDVPKTFREVHRVLKPNGYFYFSVKSKGKTKQVRVEDQGNIRHFTYFESADLKKILQEIGFKTVSFIEKPSKHRNLNWLFYFGKKIRSTSCKISSIKYGL